MEVIRENECILNDGKKYKIVIIQNRAANIIKTSEILVDDKGTVLTPEVKYIKFDREHQLFLVRDKLPIDEFMTGSIYYYVNGEGIPVGLCFFDLKDGFYSLDFKSNEEYKRNYFSYKLLITNKIRDEIIKKTEFNLDNCKKMALVKKGMIESEDKI